jgi:2-dehydropantoate 2-reductase
MKILVLGAGAIGGYFGGRLVQGGADVTFLVRARRREQLARDGLRIESPYYGDATLDVRAVAAGELEPRYDLVLFTAKAYDLDDAIATLRPAVAPGCAVLPLLNGIAHIDRLNAAFGREQVLGGAARIQVTLAPDGTIRQFNDWNTLTYGEQSDQRAGGMSERVTAFTYALAHAPGVTAKPVADIMQQMWEKAVHLATAASLTCLMRANIGEIVRTPDGAALLAELLDTNAEIAARNGHRPSLEFSASYRRIFADPQSAYSTSMLRDIERGGPVEADHVVGFMLREAERHGVEAKLLRIAYTHLKAYEARRAAGRLPV